MCWYGNEIPLIAEEDIPVIKILKNDRRSPFMKMPYELNKVYETEILVYKFRRASDVEISNGFHCYDSGCSLFVKSNLLIVKSKWLRIALQSYVDSLPYKGIIPKGTKYFINKYGEIVTESIKILGTCVG